jgi:hypothetical protein
VGISSFNYAILDSRTEVMLDDELATLAIEHNRLEARRGLLALEMGLIRPSSPDGA